METKPKNVNEAVFDAISKAISLADDCRPVYISRENAKERYI
jgi:hypothetical protein